MALLSEMVGKISAEVVTVVWCEVKTPLLSIVHFGALFEPELISDLILIPHPIKTQLETCSGIIN